MACLYAFQATWPMSPTSFAAGLWVIQYSFAPLPVSSAPPRRHRCSIKSITALGRRITSIEESGREDFFRVREATHARIIFRGVFSNLSIHQATCPLFRSGSPNRHRSRGPTPGIWAKKRREPRRSCLPPVWTCPVFPPVTAEALERPPRRVFPPVTIKALENSPRRSLLPQRHRPPSRWW
jgi:hypothetical protein